MTGLRDPQGRPLDLEPVSDTPGAARRLVHRRPPARPKVAPPATPPVPVTVAAAAPAGAVQAAPVTAAAGAALARDFLGRVVQVEGEVATDTEVTAALTALAAGTGPPAAALDARLRAAFDPRFAPIKARLVGNRLVTLGDSITIASEVGTPPGGVNRGPSIGTFASLLSRGKLTYIRNAGVGGDTSAQMLSRFDTDVAAYAPSLVHLLAGTNDSNDAAPVPLAVYAANVRALVAKCRKIGAMPVLGSLPPNEVSVARRARVIAYNTWLRLYCQTEGIDLIDYYGLLVDPATGNFKAAYYKDGTHPSNSGLAAMGALLASTLAERLATAGVPLPQDNIDANNLLTQGLFLGAVNGSGVPAGWSLTGSALPAGIAADLITTDAAIKGNWYRLAASGATAKTILFQNIPGAKVVPGNRYAFMGRVKGTGLRNADAGDGTTIYARLLFNNTQLNSAYDFRPIGNDFSYDISDGVFYAEAVAPVDATALQASFTFGAATAVASSGVAQVAQFGLYDLTAMGVV